MLRLKMVKKQVTLLIGCTDDFTDLEWILSLKFRTFNSSKTLKMARAWNSVRGCSIANSDYENLKEMTGLKMLQLNNCDLRGDIAKFMNEIPAGLRLALHQCRFICLNARLQIQPLGNFIYFVAFTFILFDI